MPPPARGWGRPAPFLATPSGAFRVRLALHAGILPAPHSLQEALLCLELERQDRLQFWAAELLLAAMTWHAAETAESRQKTAKALEDAWFRYREVLFPTLRGQRQAFLEKHLQTLTAEQGKAYRIQRDT